MCKKQDSMAPLPESSPNTCIPWRCWWWPFPTWAQAKWSGQAELFHSQNVPTLSASTLTSLSVATKTFLLLVLLLFLFLILVTRVRMYTPRATVEKSKSSSCYQDPTLLRIVPNDSQVRENQNSAFELPNRREWHFQYQIRAESRNRGSQGEMTGKVAYYWTPEEWMCAK